MIPRYPSDLRGTLAGLLGESVERVQRQLRTPYRDVAAVSADEEADGPTEITFHGGDSVYFVPHTETMSVLMAVGEMPRWGPSYALRDVTTNKFWSARVGRSICRILIWRPAEAVASLEDVEQDRCEFAIEFELESGSKFAIEYVSDEMHVDSLIVSPGVRQGDALVMVVSDE